MLFAISGSVRNNYSHFVIWKEMHINISRSIVFFHFDDFFFNVMRMPFGHIPSN